MKYINGLDSDNADETCPKDERVAWAVPPKCDKVLVITVKSGIIRCYDEGGGIFSLPMPKVEPRPKRNCDRFASYKEAWREFQKLHENDVPVVAEMLQWLFAPVAEGGES